MRWRPSIVSILSALLAATPLVAATDFSGEWVFRPSLSRNVEMMGSIQVTVTIAQTSEGLMVTEVSSVKGRESIRRLRYDLTGKAAANDGPMGDPSQTTSAWAKEKLGTTWTREGAVAGTTVVTTETRSLSPDGKTMQDEFVREGRPPIVMVFEKR